MRTFKCLSFLIACCILIVATSSQCKPANGAEPLAKSQTQQESGFAVMELFTSQGCSSCPPADNLLGKYAGKNNDHVIALAFHVDYWNRLGWIDSFSNSKYSDRQRNYAAMIDNSSVYTPQLIINGTKEFVGSDKDKIEKEVTTALTIHPELLIVIEKIQSNGNNVSVNYSVDKIIHNTEIQCALIQKQVFTNILKGENRGLKVTNYNVVRDFVSKSLTTQNIESNLILPVGYNAKDFAVVLFAQNKSTGKIIGAVKKDLE